jgi:hypothetical protein
MIPPRLFSLTFLNSLLPWYVCLFNIYINIIIEYPYRHDNMWHSANEWTRCWEHPLLCEWFHCHCYCAHMKCHIIMWCIFIHFMYKNYSALPLTAGIVVGSTLYFQYIHYCFSFYMGQREGGFNNRLVVNLYSFHILRSCSSSSILHFTSGIFVGPTLYQLTIIHIFSFLYMDQNEISEICRQAIKLELFDLIVDPRKCQIHD